MGKLRNLAESLGLVTMQSHDVTAPDGMAIASPWTTSGSLKIAAVGDLFGLDDRIVSRQLAMQVPVISQARWVACVSGAGAPFAVYDGETPIAEQPAWLTRTDLGESPQMRSIWTRDDLFFSGNSAWLTQRDEADSITHVQRLPLTHWRFDPDSPTGVDVMESAGAWRHARPLEVIVFTSPTDPMLTQAARTIRGAHNLEDSWTARVKDPIPLMTIRERENVQRLDEEIDDLIDSYVESRQSQTSSAMYVPFGLDLEVMGEVKTDLFVEGRNAAAIDVARHAAMPAAALNASPTEASLTYNTQEGTRSLALDVAATWIHAIEWRLSQDDVVAPGLSVRANLAWETSPSTPAQSTPRED